MPAEEAYILSPTDIRNIRSYVQRKYAAMPHDQRAEIVADAVKRIIHKQLPQFDLALRQTVTETLIRTSVLEKQRPVRAEDIFEACMSLDRSDSDVYDPLHDWVEQQLAISCEKPLMQRLMDELRIPEEQSVTHMKDAENGILAQLKARLDAEGIVGGKTKAPMGQAQVISMPHPGWRRSLASTTSWRNAIYVFLSFCLITATLLYGWSLNRPSINMLQPPATVLPAKPIPLEVDGLPAELRYNEIDQKRLIQYLKSKSSILAEQPYFGAIITAAKSFDIHPVILFAITGQEQSFVPTSNKRHKEIANNPFNVFHSWQEFNTNIKQSAEIAARTVYHLSLNRPDEIDPFKWINRKYAEDPKWSDGVRAIFYSILSYLDDPKKQ
ncbi:hypothetical protein FHS16_001663 [Paenibacillus endophyticus]|uniref:Uncharacterized protein n=1 Tax=Paenibacillus endophyticus TaxID=1294268 RepID=A0A7W5GA53_9BACL|nr:hypothetical protein [Paenibacillus endophyticus]MBB3151617.1 hypothetical protein [Paenibacillus endophyticus]